MGQRVRPAAGQVVEDGRAAPGGEAEVGGADAVGVGLGVLHVDVAGDGGVEEEAEAVVDAGAFAVVAAHVGVEAGEDAVEGAFAVAGGEDDGVGGEAGAGVLLGVFQVQFDPGGGDAAGGADVDAGGEDGVGPAAVEGAAVELVVDGGGGVGVDALVQLPLCGDEAVADRFGQGVEVAGVVGGEVLQAELGVLHGGEGLRAAEPVELFAAGGPVAEQVEEDLRAGLAGADDGDVSGGEECVAVGEVVGGVEDGYAGGVGEGSERVGDVGFGADAEDDVAGVGAAEGFGLAVGVQVGVVDLEETAFGVPADGVDLVVEVEGGEVFGDPAAVGVVFGALDVEALGEVEGEEAFAGPEVVEEAPGAGRVGEGDEVGEEGHLDAGAVDEQSGVPVEGGALVVEDGVEAGEGVGEGGEGEVEGADADADEVVGGVGRVGGGGGHRGCVLPGRRCGGRGVPACTRMCGYARTAQRSQPERGYSRGRPRGTGAGRVGVSACPPPVPAGRGSGRRAGR